MTPLLAGIIPRLGAAAESRPPAEGNRPPGEEPTCQSGERSSMGSPLCCPPAWGLQFGGSQPYRTSRKLRGSLDGEEADRQVGAQSEEAHGRRRLGGRCFSPVRRRFVAGAGFARSQQSRLQVRSTGSTAVAGDKAAAGSCGGKLQ